MPLAIKAMLKLTLASVIGAGASPPAGLHWTEDGSSTVESTEALQQSEAHHRVAVELLRAQCPAGCNAWHALSHAR